VWDNYRAQPTEFIDAGDTVVALGRYSGTYKATGRSMDAAFAHVWTLRDGRVVRFRQYMDTRKMAEAF
jgi:ketosteroid isomerase-like protein